MHININIRDGSFADDEFSCILDVRAGDVIMGGEDRLGEERMGWDGIE